MRRRGIPHLIAIEHMSSRTVAIRSEKLLLLYCDTVIGFVMSASSLDPKLIESIAPASLSTLPAGQPPAKTKPNFINPRTRIPVILGVGTAFLSLAVFCFFIRIDTKLVMTKN